MNINFFKVSFNKKMIQKVIEWRDKLKSIKKRQCLFWLRKGIWSNSEWVQIAQKECNLEWVVTVHSQNSLECGWKQNALLPEPRKLITLSAHVYIQSSPICRYYTQCDFLIDIQRKAKQIINPLVQVPFKIKDASHKNIIPVLDAQHNMYMIDS